MGLVASLAGHLITEARLSIPAWGASFHEVSIDGEVTLSGRVDLVVADLVVKCTVLSGGPAKGRSFYRLISGAGGLGKTLAKTSYANDAGVKLSTVVGDALQSAGETLDASSVDTQARLGASWVRPEEQTAARVLELVSPRAWYIGEDGKTRLGRRPKTALSAAATRTSQVDKARGTVTLASETIASILPGLVVDGLEALDVEHEISAKGGLRTKIWGRLTAKGVSRRLDAIRAILEQMDPDRTFRELKEYRVVLQSGERLDLQHVRVSAGMPDLSNVLIKPGVPGSKALMTYGSRVLVGFIEADPARPVVLAFDDAEGAGFQARNLSIEASLLLELDALIVKLGAGLQPVARGGDIAGIFTVTPSQVKVLV